MLYQRKPFRFILILNYADIVNSNQRERIIKIMLCNIDLKLTFIIHIILEQNEI